MWPVLSEAVLIPVASASCGCWCYSRRPRFSRSTPALIAISLITIWRHRSKKCRWCVFQAELHLPELEALVMTWECRILSVEFVNLNMLLPCIGSYCWEDPGFSNKIYAVPHLWQGIQVTYCHRIEFAIMNEKFQWSMLHKRKENTTCPFCNNRLDDFLLDHLLDIFCKRLSRSWAGAVRGALNWPSIVGCQLDLMSLCLDSPRVSVSHVLSPG